MNKFVITTDTTADVYDNYLQENNIEVIPMPYTLDGIEYGIEKIITIQEFYQKMKAGAKTGTSQISQFKAEELFERLLSEGNDILHISFSSGMSGSYENLCTLRNTLKIKYPDRKIVISDTLSGGGGEGLLVYYANEMKKKGKSIEDIYQWIEDNKMQVHHYFIVEDLDRLCKGGRISKAQAFLGNMLNIRPILELSRKGKITPIFKIRGIKKAVSTMVEMTVSQIDKSKNEFILVGHGDDFEKAKAFGATLGEKLNMPVKYNYVNTLVGSHAGVGSLVVYFIGTERKNIVI
ncbi:MAG: DegV family protein [Clostridia bacterium]